MLSFRGGTDRTSTRMFSRSSLPTSRTKHRRFLQVEPLEERVVLSTYWVSPSGSDSNPGTQTQPWLTLQGTNDSPHVASLMAGDTLDIEPGTYAGFIVGWDSSTPGQGDWYGTIAGTPGKPITIQAAPGSAPGSVIINSQNNETQFGIDLEPGCNYITISGITVNGSSGGLAEYPNHGGGIKVAGNNDIVENSTITNIDYGFGIIADNANDVLCRATRSPISRIRGMATMGTGFTSLELTPVP